MRSRRRHLLATLAVILSLGIFALPGQAPADIYGYVDREGVMHLTNIPLGPRYKVLVRERRVIISPAAAASKYDDLISKTARRYDVDLALVKAVIRAESNFDAGAVSRKGAMGLMQLMPQTARDLRVTDCFRPEENIDGGVRYLEYLLRLYGGNLPLALAAYNAGERAVERHGGVPPYEETRTYIRKVMRYYGEYRDPAGPGDSRPAAAGDGH